MRASEAKALTVALFAAYGKTNPDPAQAAVYIETLRPLNVKGAQQVVSLLIATGGEFLPRPNALLRSYWRWQLSLPEPLDAWQLACTPAVPAVKGQKCLACAGVGTRVYRPGAGADEACPTCNGIGYEMVAPPPAPPLVEEAIRMIGGRYTIRTSEQQHFVRRDFLAIYARLVEREIRKVALEGLGYEPAAALAGAEQSIVEEGWRPAGELLAASGELDYTATHTDPDL